jgi:hypothetical protein
MASCDSQRILKEVGFASNYPGIRHGGNAGGKLRDVDMRDLVMSILLAGFTPYLSETKHWMYGGL